MSQKKYNIIYLPYIETKIIFDSLILENSIKAETEITIKKLKEIEDVRTQLSVDLVFIEEQSLSEDPEVELLKESQKELINNQLEDLANSTVSINEAFKDTVSLIHLSQSSENISKYLSYLSQVDLYSQYLNTLKENYVITNLLSSQLSELWDFNKFFKIPTVKSFNIKYIMYIEEFLKSWWIQGFNLKTFLLDKKLKLKKWRLKKRKLKKLYILKRIKRVMFFRKVCTKTYAVYSYFSYFSKKYGHMNSIILMKKIPLTDRVISKNNLEFFYKLNKHTSEDLLLSANSNILKSNILLNKFKVYLRNFHQKPYWKLRKARILHWMLFSNKTIRKNRYKNFINRFMKRNETLSYNYTFFVNFFTRFFVSWTRVSKFESFFKRSLVNKDQTVLKLPLMFNSFFNWKILKKKNYFLKKKIGRWSYLNFKRSQLPWLQRKKNSPKAVNHIQPNNQLLNSLGNWDIMTGSVHLTKNLPLFTFPTKDSFKVNWQIKLHMYRYKSNRIWT